MSLSRSLTACLAALSLFLAASFLLETPAAAQDTTRSEPPLPDIAPREIEIRSEIEISFPALQRPSLDGLTRPVRPVPMPSIASPIDSLDLRASSGQVQSLPERAPVPAFEALPAPTTGLLEAGGGRYFTRYGKGRLSLPLSQSWALTTRLDYDGTDGFQPFDDETVETPSDVLKGAFSIGTEREGFNAHLNLDGFLERYTLYGTDLGRPPTPIEHPDRNAIGGSAALQLETNGSVPFTFLARYGATHVETDVFEESPFPGEEGDPNTPFQRLEQRLSGRTSLRIPIGALALQTDAHGHIAGLDADGRLERDVQLLDAGAALDLPGGPSYRLALGGRVMTYALSAEPPPSGSEKRRTYPAPMVDFAWHFAPALTFYAFNRPGAEANTLADLYRENPYLVDEPAQQPTIRTVNARGGLRLFADLLELDAYAGYQYAPNFLFFEDVGAANYEQGLLAARYGSARILQAGGTLSLRQTGRFHASIGATYREGRLTETDTDIPYFAPLTAQALFSLAFAEGRGLLQLTSTLESARYISRAQEEKVDTFIDLDIEGSYDLTPALSVIGRAANLSAGALERYNHYPQPPLVFSSGLRVHW